LTNISKTNDILLQQTHFDIKLYIKIYIRVAK